MQSGGGYRVQVLRSPAGDGQSAMFALPFTALELENFVLKVGRFGREPGESIRRPSLRRSILGERLFDAVFTGAVAECLHRSVAHAVENNMLLRIRLRLSDCPDLANLPWELLYDSSDDWFLALSDRTPVVRYLQLPDPPRPLHVTLPLRVLVIKSEPVDYGHLDLDAEWAQVASALGELTGEGSIVLTELAAPTLSELRRALLRDTFHVVHYMGMAGSTSSTAGSCYSLTVQATAGRPPAPTWA